VDIVRITFLLGAVIGVPAVLVAYIVGADRLIRLLPARQQPAFRPWIWVGPALILVGGFLVYPVIATLWISLLSTDGHQFVGLGNYGIVLSDNSVLTSFIASRWSLERQTAQWELENRLRCAFCGTEFSDDQTHCPKCGKLA